jgi:hypothetical protein
VPERRHHQWSQQSHHGFRVHLGVGVHLRGPPNERPRRTRRHRLSIPDETSACRTAGAPPDTARQRRRRSAAGPRAYGQSGLRDPCASRLRAGRCRPARGAEEEHERPARACCPFGALTRRRPQIVDHLAVTRERETRVVAEQARHVVTPAAVMLPLGPGGAAEGAGRSHSTATAPFEHIGSPAQCDYGSDGGRPHG